MRLASRTRCCSSDKVSAGMSLESSTPAALYRARFEAWGSGTHATGNSNGVESESREACRLQACGCPEQSGYRWQSRRRQARRAVNWRQDGTGPTRHRPRGQGGGFPATGVWGTDERPSAWTLTIGYSRISFTSAQAGHRLQFSNVAGCGSAIQAGRWFCPQAASNSLTTRRSSGIGV